MVKKIVKSTVKAENIRLECIAYCRPSPTPTENHWINPYQGKHQTSTCLCTTLQLIKCKRSPREFKCTIPTWVRYTDTSDIYQDI